MADKKSSFPKYKFRQVRTPVMTASFPKVHEVDDFKGQRKFKCTAYIDAAEGLEELKKVALEVAKEVYPTRSPEKVNVLIKDGDDLAENAEEGKKDFLKGMLVITANCNEDHPPTIVGPDKKPLPGKLQVRNGDQIKLVVQPIPSDTPIKGTIAFRLLAVQLIEKRSSSGDATDLFDDEGEGFGSQQADSEPSTGADAGGFDDDGDLPF